MKQFLGKGDGVKNMLAIFLVRNIFTSLIMFLEISTLIVFSDKMFLRSLLKLFVGLEVKFKEWMITKLHGPCHGQLNVYQQHFIVLLLKSQVV